MLDVAERMLSRWRQGDFLRYMRHEFARHHLQTYDVEPVDPERPVPTPAEKEKSVYWSWTVRRPTAVRLTE